MPRLPIAIASYPTRHGHLSAVDPERLSAGRRLAACLMIAMSWLLLMVVAHDQVTRSMFLIKLLAAPFAFAFVVAAVEIPRLLLGASPGDLARSWDGMSPIERGFAGIAIAMCAVGFLVVSGAFAYMFLR